MFDRLPARLRPPAPTVSAGQPGIQLLVDVDDAIPVLTPAERLQPLNIRQNGRVPFPPSPAGELPALAVEHVPLQPLGLQA